jgi:hypothetical protein
MSRTSRQAELRICRGISDRAMNLSGKSVVVLLYNFVRRYVGYDTRDNRRTPGGYLTAESHHHMEAGHAACLDRGLMTRHRGSELTARRISLQSGEQREAVRFVYDPQIQCRCKAIIRTIAESAGQG